MPEDAGTIVVEPLGAEDLHIGVGSVEVEAPDGGTMRLTRINLGVLGIEATLSFVIGTLAASSQLTTAFTIDGVRPGYPIVFGESSGVGADQFSLEARVTAINTVKLTARNHTASPVVAGTVSVKVIVFPVSS